MSGAESEFDFVTHYQYLLWKVRCGEATATEFQRLVEEASAKLRPGFIKVRPYGSQGDNKSDGLYWEDGTHFQVYSPLDYKQDALLKKIEIDLAGAIENQKGLQRWVFVYNVRFGLQPDIEPALAEQRLKYPDVAIEPLSSEDLWAQMRDQLDVQRRAEVLLAAVPDYASLTLPQEGEAELKARVAKGRIVITQGVLSQVDLSAATQAIAPDASVLPIQIQVPWPSEWAVAFEMQRAQVQEMLEAVRHLSPRFAIFSMAPIPLAIQLGFLLSDRVDATSYQFHRERNSWGWDMSLSEPPADLLVTGIPDSEMPDVREAVIRVSLSALVRKEDSAEAVGIHELEVDISIAEPNVLWLSQSSQAKEFEKRYRETLAQIAKLAPRCEVIHLFFAGPTPCAIAAGQVLNPTMHPALCVYEYSRQANPRYRHVLTLP